MPGDLTHVNSDGKAHMVDVSGKPTEVRVAEAAGSIIVQPETIELIRDNQIKKGDVLTVAKIAGISAAKRTADLIPLCHPLALDQVTVECELGSDRVFITGTARCVGRTGVEMEALTAVSVAALTVYDMCKAADKKMTIADVRLVRKEKRPIESLG